MMFGSLLTAMVTPFDEKGEVSVPVTQQLVAHLIATGTDGLVVHGTTGESPTLTHEEEFDLYRLVKQAAAGRAKVIAGTGSNSTRTTIRSTQEAEKIGVDAAMVVVPYYNKPSQAGMLAHFRAVAKETALPIVIYNIPGRTGVNMHPETIATLAEVPNIVAVKEAAGSVVQVAQIRRLVPDDFLIYSGDDGLTLPFLSVGACGVISVASHLVGEDLKSMMGLFFAGKHQEAEKVHRKLVPLFDALFMTSNPVPIKAALEMLGLPVGGPRLPLVPLSPDEKARLASALTGLGVARIHVTC